MINFTPVTSAEDYKTLVEQFSFLVDVELKKFENITSADEANTAALAAPKLISLVNTVGYLRGQDNAFLEIRPKEVVGFQKDLYANERVFEDKLKNLLNKISSLGQKKIYDYRIDEYFIETRSIV